MSTATLPDGIHHVLTAPRGQRFTKPATPRTHQARMLDQMADNPRVRYRLDHGELPAWIVAPEERTPPRQRPAPPTVPHPRTPSEPSPGTQPPSRPRPSRPPVPVPPRRPGSHRKPRRRTGWILAGHTLAATAGACVYHLLGFLG